MTTLIAERVGRWVPPASDYAVVNINYFRQEDKRRIPADETQNTAPRWDESIHRWVVLSWRPDGKASEVVLYREKVDINKSGKLTEDAAQRMAETWRAGPQSRQRPRAAYSWNSAPPRPSHVDDNDAWADAMRKASAWSNNPVDRLTPEEEAEAARRAIELERIRQARRRR